MMHTIHLDLSITKGDVILQKNPRKQRNIKDSVSLGEKLHCKDTQQKIKHNSNKSHYISRYFD